MLRIFLFSFLFFQIIVGYGQRNIKDSTINLVAIGGQFGLQLPLADMADRFGGGGVTGGSFLFKTKSNWTLSAEYNFVYGNQIKEPEVYTNLLTSNGDLINREGSPVQVLVNQRGHMAELEFGRVFPVLGPNPNSGLHAQVGLGFLQHRLNIMENSETVPQLQGEYLKGYDRMVYGWSVSQAFGYQYFSNYKMTNFYIGVQATQGFTQGRRSWNYVTERPDTDARLDVILSLVVKWYFPLYKRQPKDYYYY